MTRSELINSIYNKQSYLCIGLDPDINRLPKCLQKYHDPVFEFNRAIIGATRDFCVAYKPNLAFYEALGTKGWESLEKTLQVIPEDMFTIADAKRGDIGNTSKLYARAFFEQLDFDAITVAPYMGEDSIKPFLEFDGKWVIILALTSNPGASDFQTLKTKDGHFVYEQVLARSRQWGDENRIMYVVGANKQEELLRIRRIVPDHFLLVPGVGAQGGNLQQISAMGFTRGCGMLVNASRSIIYASSGDDFAVAAAREAAKLQTEMAGILKNQSQ